MTTRGTIINTRRHSNGRSSTASAYELTRISYEKTKRVMDVYRRAKEVLDRSRRAMGERP